MQIPGIRNPRFNVALRTMVNAERCRITDNPLDLASATS